MNAVAQKSLPPQQLPQERLLLSKKTNGHATVDDNGAFGHESRAVGKKEHRCFGYFGCRGHSFHRVKTWYEAKAGLPETAEGHFGMSQIAGVHPDDASDAPNCSFPWGMQAELDAIGRKARPGKLERDALRQAVHRYGLENDRTGCERQCRSLIC